MWTSQELVISFGRLAHFAEFRDSVVQLNRGLARGLTKGHERKDISSELRRSGFGHELAALVRSRESASVETLRVRASPELGEGILQRGSVSQGARVIGSAGFGPSVGGSRLDF